MATKKLRVKPWEGNAVVRHPDTGQYVSVDRSLYFTPDNPIVKAHGWLFASDEDIESYYDTGMKPVDSVQLDGPARRRRA